MQCVTGKIAIPLLAKACTRPGAIPAHAAAAAVRKSHLRATTGQGALPPEITSPQYRFLVHRAELRIMRGKIRNELLHVVA